MSGQCWAVVRVHGGGVEVISRWTHSTAADGLSALTGARLGVRSAAERESYRLARLELTGPAS